MKQDSAQRRSMLRLGGWSASVSGTIAAIGLVLWFARFAFPGGPVGWFNDLLVMIHYALALPIAILLHAVFSRYNRTLSWLALIVGVAGMVGVVILQLYALWAAALVVAGQGSRLAMAATLPLCAVGALGNGLSIVTCPPPCGGAAPIGDLTHIGSLVFGVWALYDSGRAPRQPRAGHFPAGPRGAQPAKASPAS